MPPPKGGKHSRSIHFSADQKRRKYDDSDFGSSSETSGHEAGAFSVSASSAFPEARGSDAQLHRQSVTQNVSRAKDVLHQFTSRNNFAYVKKLLGHKSCVNALAFSRGQGRWLASAGDDRKIYIRDVLQGPGQATAEMPVLQLQGHVSNIFSLSWSAQDNKFLFSAGNDGRILQYDLEHSPMPLLDPSMMQPEKRTCSSINSLGAHQESVAEISTHPSHAHLLLSCDDSGMLKLIDVRMPQPCVAATGLAGNSSAFCSVQWNPNETDGNTFAAATSSATCGSTRLFDVRRCFSSSHDPTPFTNKDALVNYHTNLLQNSCRHGYLSCTAMTNSICFDPSGKLLASSLSRSPTTLYAIGDPDPLATFTSYNSDQVIRERSEVAPKVLQSSCTLKHGSFGFESQLGKLHYAVGSDDFQAYVFRVPNIETLKIQREFINLPAWVKETTRSHQRRSTDPSQPTYGDSETVYTQGAPSSCRNVVRPVKLDRPQFVLPGGQSIINATVMHPTLTWIATAGIENCVRLYSAAPFYPFAKSRNKFIDTDHGTRIRYRQREAYGLMDLYSSSDSDLEDDSSNEDDSIGSEGSLHYAHSDQSAHNEAASYQGVDHEEDSSESEDYETTGFVHSTANPDVPDMSEANANNAGSVHDFLTAMRTDPLFVTPSPTNSQDFQEDEEDDDDELSSELSVISHASRATPPAGSDARSLCETCQKRRHLYGCHEIDPIFRHTPPPRDDESDRWTSDEDNESTMFQDAETRRLRRYAHFDFMQGPGSTYWKQRLWVINQVSASSEAEKKRISLFDQLLLEDEQIPLMTGSKTRCQLNLSDGT